MDRANQITEPALVHGSQKNMGSSVRPATVAIFFENCRQRLHEFRFLRETDFLSHSRAAALRALLKGTK